MKTENCDSCGNSYPVEQLIEFDGQLLCSSCLESAILINSCCDPRIQKDENAGDMMPLFASASTTTMDNNISALPKSFWKFYDLYRRKQITLLEFSRLTGFSEDTLRAYLKTV